MYYSCEAPPPSPYLYQFRNEALQCPKDFDILRCLLRAFVDHLITYANAESIIVCKCAYSSHKKQTEMVIRLCVCVFVVIFALLSNVWMAGCL